jgi:hypothetical protein
MTLTSDVTVVTDTASLDDINANGIVIYPNPVSEKLYIKSNRLNANTLSIIDALGRTVRILKNAQSMKSINLSNLDNGIYILKTDTNKQFRFIKK